MIVPTAVLNFSWAKSVIANAGVQEGYINSAIQQWQQADQQMFQITLGPNAAEGWIDALDGVHTGTADGYTYKIPTGYNAWVSNPGSSSATVCISTGSSVPSDCPAGATPVTF